MSKSGLSEKRNCVTRINTGDTEVIIPATIATGEFNSTNIESLISQYETGIVYFEKDYEPIKFITDQYGDADFYSSVTNLNNYIIRDEIKVLITIDNYPLLAERIKTGVIFSPIEVARFISDFGYTPVGLSIGTSVVSNKIITELEAFYTENFSNSTMGGFCALLPDVFGAVGIFFNALDDVENLVNKLKNFSLDFSLKSLLDNLKKNITDIIDKVIEKVKGIIENFSISNMIEKIETKIQETIALKFYDLKQKALEFFEAINIENFKKKIDALIDYSINIFKDPKIEEVQFLLFRFCSFISKIEEGMNELINPLDNYVNNYQTTMSVIKSRSSINTIRAVEAGAIRYDDTKTQTGVNAGRAAVTEKGNIPPATAVEIGDLPRWNNGNGDYRISFNGKFRKPRQTGGGNTGGMGDEAPQAWNKVQPYVKLLLMRLRAEFSKEIGREIRLNMTSGYRPPWYNTQVGGHKNSYHKAFTAFDCVWDGMNSREKQIYARIARKVGFTEVLVYPKAGSDSSFVHTAYGGKLPSDEELSALLNKTYYPPGSQI